MKTLIMIYILVLSISAYGQSIQEFSVKSNIEYVEVEAYPGAILFQSSRAPTIHVIQPRNKKDSTDTQEWILRGIAYAKEGIKSVKINHEKVDTLNTNDIWEKRVALQEGENTFLVEVLSNVNKMSKDTISLFYTSPLKPKSKNYLFLIAADQYLYWPSLSYAVKDAKDIASELISKYQFHENDVIKLFNKDVNIEKIDQIFKELIQKATPQDNVLIYYAGHGYIDKIINEGYWVMASSSKYHTTHDLSNAALLKYIKALPTKHTLIMVDACFSGSLYMQNESRGSDYYAENASKFKSRWLFASGRLEKVDDAMIGIENSPFANYLIKFLKENKKESFLATDLFQYVKKAVANNTRQTPIDARLKDMGDEGGEFIFRLKNENK